MAPRTLGVVMNGVTGRMGYRQHLVRSMLAINEQGGVELADGSRVRLEPLLVGRDSAKLSEIAERHGLTRWTTDLDAALGDEDCPIYFDSLLTAVREKSLVKAIDAGKNIYTEKPIAESVASSFDFPSGARGVRLAEAGLESSRTQRRVELEELHR